MKWPFKRKPKKCPNCGLPYQQFAKVHEWYTGGWVSGDGENVPLIGHATYANGQMLHYEFPWQEIGFDDNLGLMPKHILVCGCNTQ